jgi:hypothetical protein
MTSPESKTFVVVYLLIQFYKFELKIMTSPEFKMFILLSSDLV